MPYFGRPFGEIRKRWVTSVRQGVTLSTVLDIFIGCASRTEHPKYADLVQGSGGTVAVIGDTQHTLSTERLLMRRERNEAEQPAILADLVARHPRALVHLGDLVGNASPSAWRALDQLLQGVREAGIPVLPVFGNHDYWRGRVRGETELWSRFPALGRGHWYSRQLSGLLLIALDSNVRELSPAKWQAQRRWLQAQLDAADVDPTMTRVLLFVHHPPYTNSRVTGDEKHVQAAFVGPFASHRKTLAMFSGHAHAYEHFAIGGKTFIVCGGGGGPRVALRSGNARRHQDLFTGPSPRPHHYVLVSEDQGGLRVLVRGMEKGESGLRDVDSFILP